MAQRTMNPFAYGAYPTDPAWGQVGSNLIEAIFGDPAANAQAKVQRAQIGQYEADARVNNANADRQEWFNNNLKTFDPSAFSGVYMPQDTAAYTPAVPVSQTAIGGVPMAVASGGVQGAAAVPNGQGGFTWVAPVASNKITSGFGPRSAPIAGASTNHGGIDIGEKAGAPVMAAGPGRVIQAWFDDKYGGGNSVRIQHPDGSITGYAHLNDFSVKPGMEVSGGQAIGTVGSTGRATGPHLHMTYRANEKAARSDPSFILKGGSAPASGLASAMTGGAVSQQPIAQIAPPALGVEAGGARVDPRNMAEMAGRLFLSGFAPEYATSFARIAGAFGDDYSMRGALAAAGVQPTADLARSRQAGVNNNAVEGYYDTSKEVTTGNITQVGGTQRQAMSDQTSITNNNNDNATLTANNIRDNATSRANAGTQANATITAAGMKSQGVKPLKAADTDAMGNLFDATTQVGKDDRDSSYGDMRQTVLATAGEIFSSGGAQSHAEAVQAAMEAHGVNRGPSAKDPKVEVWRWQRTPKSLPRVVATPAGGTGGNSNVTLTNW